MTSTHPKDVGQLKIRIPPELRAALQEIAVGNRRTVTMEIVARLERSIASDRANESPRQ